MLSCAEQTAGLFEVHMIRGANMYDGHGGIGCQFVERSVGAFRGPAPCEGIHFVHARCQACRERGRQFFAEPQDALCRQSPVQ